MAAGGFYHWTGLSVTKLFPSTCVTLESGALLFTPSEPWHRHYSYLLHVLGRHSTYTAPIQTSSQRQPRIRRPYHLHILFIHLRSLCENTQRFSSHTGHINRDEVGWLNRLLTRQIGVPPRVLASRLWTFAVSVKHWRTRGPAGLWFLGKCGEDQS